MDRPLRQYNENFNDIVILFVIIILSLLTDYVPSATLRYSIGYIIIYFLYAQLTVNTIFLVVDILR